MCAVAEPATIGAVAWADWNPVAAARPWSVGAEEEVMLLDPRTWTLAGRSAEVLAHLPGPLAAQVSPETHDCVVELITTPHRTVAALARELAGLRAALGRELARRGLAAAASGTHPTATWQEVGVSPTARYRALEASMRVLARREPTFGLHVHVAVPGGEAAVRALDGLRADLPVLLAVAANSPFWQGRDTGLASARIPVLSMFPRVHLPRRFGSYAAYVAAVEALVRGGAIPDPSFIWWDARLQPRLGTVEVRIMDAQTRIADTAALCALVQCLVRVRAQEDTGPDPVTPEALAENRFLASRDGVEARLLRAPPLPPEPVRARVERLMEACRPVAPGLGCAAELGTIADLLRDPGHARQRAAAQQDGIPGLMAGLRAEFAPAGGASRRPPVAPAAAALARSG